MKVETVENPHAKKTDELLKSLLTDPDKGLGNSDVKERQKTFGLNKLEESKEKSLWGIFLDQVKTPVVYLLLAASVLSFMFGDIPEGVAIAVVILINAAIGFGMEVQARNSMKALKEMERIHARVIREGEQKSIDAVQLVPGDIILLEAGDLVPADGRLIQSSETQINESSLTGESVPVEKNTATLNEDTEIAERYNMVFKGTAVTRGKAVAVITSTGMKTELGNISALVSSEEEESIPLNERLQTLTKKLIWIVLGMAAALGISGTFTNKPLYEIIQTAIAWAIAAIPEGLPIVASIALAKGMLRLAKHQVVVKKLAAVEALGETNLILTDKTGTLTENRLTVHHISFPDEDFKIEWNQKAKELSFDLKEKSSESFGELIKISSLCNNADYNPDDEGKSEGDPLEIGLLKFVHYHDAKKKKEWRELEKTGEDPFDSESKMMGTIHKTDEGFYIAAKGAAKSILKKSTKILVNGDVSNLSEEEKENWQKKNDDLANDGLRTLAFAFRTSKKKPVENEEDEFIEDLIFVGLIGFIDPPQEDVKEAIKTCLEAGVEVAMVTGDHAGTARNIAEQVGLTKSGDPLIVHGSELGKNEISDEDLLKARIFSRVNPEQKYTIVEKFRNSGMIVGMTGDGVNDAPALKKADIGIAMGMRGTQVAKEVADMVLKDDSFPSIVRAIRQGRIIFSNIRKFIVFQLSYHFGEILVIAAITFSLFRLPLLPLQLLFLNILLDVFPALALGIGEGKAEIMKDPPKDSKEPILHKKSWISMLVYGSIIAAVITGAYLFAYFIWDESTEICNNIAFFALGFSQLLHVFDMRDPSEHILFNQVTKNKYVWMAIAFCAALLILSYFIPGLNSLLSLETLDMRIWILIAAASILPMLLIQLIKRIFRL